MKETKQLITETGIGVLGSVVWGTHVCLFYRTREDLINILVSYFKAGLENNEFCMWITSALLGPTEAKSAMKKAIPDFDKYLKKGQMEIFPHDRWYLDHGIFDKERALNGWKDRLRGAIDNGYAGMRIKNNTTWLNEAVWESFMNYEVEMNETIDRFQIIALCAYCLDNCGTSEMVDVINSHQLVLIEQQGKWRLVKNAERKRAEKRAKEYQAQLKSLASQLSKVQEQERRNVAVEMHERVSQRLAMAKFDVQILAESCADAETSGKLHGTAEEISRVIEDVYSLVLELSNPVLYEVGLKAAVEALLKDKIRPEHGIEYELTADENLKLDELIKVPVYQAARELVTNAIKHSRANKVVVDIHRAGDTVQVRVEDNGVGFDTSIIGRPTAGKEGGFGLFGIKENLEYINGNLEIKSEPGKGTVAIVTAPLKYKAETGLGGQRQ